MDTSTTTWVTAAQLALAAGVPEGKAKAILRRADEGRPWLGASLVVGRVGEEPAARLDSLPPGVRSVWESIWGVRISSTPGVGAGGSLNTQGAAVPPPSPPAVPQGDSAPDAAARPDPDQWLTIAEVAELTGLTDKAIRQACERGEYRAREASSRARAGWSFEIALSSLPQAVQIDWRRTHQPTPETQSAADLSRWVSSQGLRLSPAQMADPKIQVKLRAYRALAGDAPCGAVDRLASELEVSRQTLWRWRKEIEALAGGVAALPKASPAIVVLDPAVGLGLELPTGRAFCADALRWGVAAFMKEPRRGRLSAFGRLKAEAGANGWRVGDYSTFTRLLDRVSLVTADGTRVPGGLEVALDFARKGQVGAELQYAPKITRAWLEVPVYEALVGDQHIFDYETVDPDTGQIVVPECYAWVDCSSRYWAGVWPMAGHYNQFAVGMSLREACRIAIPDGAFFDFKPLTLDNGKPERSDYVQSLPLRLRTLNMTAGSGMDFRGRYGVQAEEEGIKYAKPGVPWVKPIESYFNRLELALMDRGLPGYRKRAQEAWEGKTDARRLKGERDKGKLMTTLEFFGEINAVFGELNRRGMRLRERPGVELVPLDLLMAGLQRRALPRLADDALDTLFLPRVDRLPRQGAVQVTVGQGPAAQHRVYEAAAVLAPFQKAHRKVAVYFDPFDVEAPAVLTTLEGEWLGNAQPWPVTRVNDSAAVRAAIVRQKELVRFWRGAIRALQAPAVAAGGPVAQLGQVVRVERQRSEDAAHAERIASATEQADAMLIDLAEARRARRAG